MSYLSLEKRIEEIIQEPVESMGYDIVRVKVSEGGNKTLQIMAERKSDQKLGIEDCTKISRKISTILDVENPIADEYNLEVSSPGIDRPLVRIKDFQQFAGKNTKISTKIPIEGRKRFKGELAGTTEDSSNVILKMDEGEVLIPFENIASAKLVLTNKLIEEATR